MVRLDSLVIGLLVFTAVILAGTSILKDINDNYADQGVNFSTGDFVEVFNTTDQIFKFSEDVKNDTFGGELNDEDTASSMFLGAYSALRAVKSTFTLFGDLGEALTKKLPIDPVFVVIAKLVISLMIIFAIIYLIFRVVG